MTKKKEELKKTSVAPVKTITIEDAKKACIYGAQAPIDPQNQLSELASKLLPAAIAKGQVMAEGKLYEKMDAVSLAYSLESGQALVESVDKRMQGLALQMKKEMEKEFECKTPSERALVDQAVNCYIRKLSLSRRMMRNQDFDFYSPERTGHFSFLSKEIDRAHRQFITAIETLKLLRQPSLKVNVRTNTAIIGENQQFNNKVENNEAK